MSGYVGYGMDMRVWDIYKGYGIDMRGMVQI